MISPMRDRNIEITTRFLQNGERYSDLAREYGLSHGRIRQIVYGYCHKACREIFRAYVEAMYPPRCSTERMDRAWFLKHRDAFLKGLNDLVHPHLPGQEER